MVLFNYLKKIISDLFKNKTYLSLLPVLISLIILIICDLVLQYNILFFTNNNCEYINLNKKHANTHDVNTNYNNNFIVELRKITLLVYSTYYMFFISFGLFSILILKPIKYFSDSVWFLNQYELKKKNLFFSKMLKLNLIVYYYFCFVWNFYIILKISIFFNSSKSKTKHVYNKSVDGDFDIWLESIKYNKITRNNNSQISDKIKFVEIFNNFYYNTKTIKIKFKYLFEVCESTSLKSNIKNVYIQISQLNQTSPNFHNIISVIKNFLLILHRHYVSFKNIKNTISLSFRLGLDKFSTVDYLTYYLNTTNFFNISYLIVIFWFVVSQLFLIFFFIILKIKIYSYIIHHYGISKILNRVLIFSFFLLLIPIINYFLIFFILSTFFLLITSKLKKFKFFFLKKIRIDNIITSITTLYLAVLPIILIYFFDLFFIFIIQYVVIVFLFIIYL